MDFDALSLLGAILGIVLFQSGMIWFAYRAKPLGDKPYHWGRYVGLSYILLALIFLALTPQASDHGNTAGAILLVMFALMFVVSGVGILRRNKTGVIFFFIASLSTLSINLTSASMTDGQLSNLVAFSIMFACSGIYFVKRWRLMGRPLDKSPGLQRPPSVHENR